MPRPTEELTKHTVWLFAGDMQKLTELYPRKATFVIRKLVRKVIADVEAQQTPVNSTDMETDL